MNTTPQTAIPPKHPVRSLGCTAHKIEQARELRQAAKPAEQQAWELLRSEVFNGFKFRRQQPLGPYIADFYCAKRRLVVELDGSIHAQPSHAQRDAKREAKLRCMGYEVLRFPNGIVESAPEEFVRKVLNVVRMLPEVFGGRHPLTPNPSPPRGGGER